MFADTESIWPERPAEHAGPILDHVNGFDIIDCEACGFRHVMPLPGVAAQEAAYRDAYYTEEKPTYLTRAREDQEWASLASRDRLEALLAHLDPHLPAPRRLLDVGCGPGFFLEMAKQEGWNVLGVEPSRQAAAHARKLGVNVLEGFFGPVMAEMIDPVHAVHMNNVLEHVPNPIELVETARRVLHPGGLVCVGVPNDYNAFQRALREADGYKPWWLAPPHHLNYFDFESLERLLTRQGFTVLDATATFPMELFLLMGENYVGDDAAGRACHARRKRFDLTLEKAGLGDVRRRLYRALGGAGLGREISIIARKS